MDGQNYDSQDRASIAASRGKNRMSNDNSDSTQNGGSTKGDEKRQQVKRIFYMLRMISRA